MADQMYEVEDIIDRKKLPNQRILYLVRWRGFSSEHDTWEPTKNLKACSGLLNIFNYHKKVAKEKEISKPVLFPKQKADRVSNDVIKMRVKKKIVKPNTVKESVISKKSWKLSKLNLKTVPASKETHAPSQQESDSNTASKTLKRKAKGTEKKFELRRKSDSLTISHKVDNKESNGPSKSKSRKCLSMSNISVASSETDGKSSKLSKDSKSDGCLGDSSSEDEEDDDNILYSLNFNEDLETETESKPSAKDSVNKKKRTTVKVKGEDDSKKTVITKVEPVQTVSRPSDAIKSNKKKKKNLFLLDSKKQTKDWLEKSDTLCLDMPASSFTSVKHLTGNSPPEHSSKPSGNSLPHAVSPEASETYLAEVPSSYPLAAAEEPISIEQPLSPGSISYKSLVGSLPDQLHLPHLKGGKKGPKSAVNGRRADRGLLGARFGAGSGGEPVERRTSVRSTECAFRYKEIVVKKCVRYTQIWLNTHTKMKNALNPQVIQEIVSALSSAKYDDSHLVLFSSLGNVFCSGTDLHFLVAGDRRVAARQMADSIRELTKTFITFPKPIIAAVSGASVGLGVSLLALCDVVYASDKASFHLPYSQLSQTPEGCASFTLPLTLGLSSANELLYGSRKITAMEAYQLGLVSQVFWPTLIMQEVIPRAQNMATSSAKALEATKLLVRSHHRTKMELTNETECNLLLERWSSVDCQQAIEAYISNENNISF